MAHKTMVDGTAYGISGGKALIDGTAFSIKGGKTLVDGTAYDVGFGGAGANVKVTVSNIGLLVSQPNSTNAYFSIDGVKHNVAEEFVVPIGTNLSCYCSRGSNTSGKVAIYLNGAEVQYTTNDRYHAGYSYAVNGDIEVVLQSGITMTSGGGSMTTQLYEAYIYITEL